MHRLNSFFLKIWLNTVYSQLINSPCLVSVRFLVFSFFFNFVFFFVRWYRYSRCIHRTSTSLRCFTSCWFIALFYDFIHRLCHRISYHDFYSSNLQTCSTSFTLYRSIMFNFSFISCIDLQRLVIDVRLRRSSIRKERSIENIFILFIIVVVFCCCCCCCCILSKDKRKIVTFVQ